jgi:UDP-N-acetylglucosamine--N-acetylmuramyl-(pentapeptide) pyrophosphoryl-undecaprenol N-acetylglucosamine transferase
MMNKRIYVAVFGSGLGHITRVMPVVEYFQRMGVEFEFSSFNEALVYLRERGYACNEVPRIDAVFDSSGKVSSSGTVKALPKDLANFGRQITAEIRSMERFKPDLVISDSRLSSVFASTYLGIPIITILNQIKILLPRMYGRRASSTFERIDGEILGIFWSWSKEVLLPDLPPPYSISDWGLGHIWSVAKSKYVGFMVNLPKVQSRETVLRNIGLDPHKPLVFFQISGPGQSKERLINLSLEACDGVDRGIQTVVSYGNPKGSHVPYRRNTTLIYEWCPIKEDLFAACDTVVARSGHSTIAQAILLGKPIVAIPIPDHTEQLRNAERVEELGFGLNLTEQKAKESMIHAVLKTIEDQHFMKKANELQKIAKNYNGLEACKQIVKNHICV